MGFSFHIRSQTRLGTTVHTLGHPHVGQSEHSRFFTWCKLFWNLKFWQANSCSCSPSPQESHKYQIFFTTENNWQQRNNNYNNLDHGWARNTGHYHFLLFAYLFFLIWMQTSISDKLFHDFPFTFRRSDNRGPGQDSNCWSIAPRERCETARSSGGHKLSRRRYRCRSAGTTW